MISSVVAQICGIHEVSPCHSAFHTERGAGSRYSRMPPKLTAACQLARRNANSTSVGQYWRLRWENFVIRAER